MTSEHLSTETIDLMLLGALPVAALNTAKHHLDDCASCRERWRELNDDRKHFDDVVFARTLPKLTARLVKPAQVSPLDRFKLWAVLPLLGVLTAAAMSVAMIRPHEPTFDISTSAAGSIRFVVNAHSSKYLLVLSRSTQGDVAVRYPPGAEQSERISQARVELDGSTVSGLAGRLVAVFSDEPVNARDVQLAIDENPAAPRIAGATIVMHELL